MIYFYYLLLGLSIIFVLLMLYYYVNVLVSLVITRGVPYVPSFNSDLNLIKKLKIQNCNTILDLGCGDGKALRFFVKYFDFKKALGYELNMFAVHFGRAVNKLKGYKNIELHYANFNKADFKDIDYVFVYLLPETLEKIEDWVFENIQDNTIIISNSFQFKKHEPFDTVKNKKGYSKIYLYKK